MKETYVLHSQITTHCYINITWQRSSAKSSISYEMTVLKERNAGSRRASSIAQSSHTSLYEMLGLDRSPLVSATLLRLWRPRLNHGCGGRCWQSCGTYGSSERVLLAIKSGTESSRLHCRHHCYGAAVRGFSCTVAWDARSGY